MKPDYRLPYIENKRVFKAVTFALKMMKDMAAGLAIYKAAKYYGVNQKEVASYCGQAASATKVRKDIFWNYKGEICQDKFMTDDELLEENDKRGKKYFKDVPMGDYACEI